MISNEMRAEREMDSLFFAGLNGRDAGRFMIRLQL